LAIINAAVGSVSLPGCPQTVQLMVTEGTLALPYLELRGLLAHEMGHIVLKHAHAKAQRRANEAAIIIKGDDHE
jgi:Zn-dependent protease with chaperone function